MRPVPIAATLIRLLGAFLPNTLAGTIDGIASNAEALIVLLKNSRRDCLFFFIIPNFRDEYFYVVSFWPHPPSPSPSGEGAVPQILNDLYNFQVSYESQFSIYQPCQINQRCA